MSTNVPNLAAFATLPTIYKSHALFYVSTLRDYFRLERGNTDAPDGITRIAYAGGGNFVRMEIAAPEWSYAPTFWVNASAGADEADGSQRTAAGTAGPLKSYAELFRRLGRVVRPRVVQTWNQENDCPEYLTFAVSPEAGSKIIWQGLPIQQTPTTITTAINLAAGTSGAGSGTVTAAIAGWTPSAELHRLVLDAATGRFCWVALDQNGVATGRARLSPWTDINLTDPTNTVTIGNAANGDGITTYTLPKVAGIDLQVMASIAAASTGGKFVANYLAIEGATGVIPRTRIVSLGQQAIFQNCVFSTNLPRIEGGSYAFNNCAFTGGGGTILGNDLWTFATFNAGLISIGLTLNRKSVLTLQSHVLFEQAGTLNIDGGSNLTVTDACFCDMTNAIALYHRSSLRLATTLWGLTNSGAGVLVEPNCHVEIGPSATPTLTGTDGDLKLDGDVYQWGECPVRTMSGATLDRAAIA